VATSSPGVQQLLTTQYGLGDQVKQQTQDQIQQRKKKALQAAMPDQSATNQLLGASGGY
jgi:hypothetical protein